MGPKFFYRDIDLLYFVNNKLISNNLINQKDRVLLSSSGGQDSICLLFILNQLYSQLELDITFFWCHHLWQTDSFYLMQQMAKLSFLFQFNSCFAIPLNFISSELLARKWRQSCNYRVSFFYNYSKICLAHTVNDKVETIFLNFMRGTGVVGLSPLRWTQLISKNNITNENNISQHQRSCNYLSSGVSESNGLNMCRPSIQSNKVFAKANSDKLKNLTKKVINKFFNYSKFDLSDPLPLDVYFSIPYLATKRRVCEGIPQTSLLTKLATTLYSLPVSDSTSAFNSVGVKALQNRKRQKRQVPQPATQGKPRALLYKSKICKCWLRACEAEGLHRSSVLSCCTVTRYFRFVNAGACLLIRGKPQYQSARQRKPSILGKQSSLWLTQKLSFTKEFVLPSCQRGKISLRHVAKLYPIGALLPCFVISCHTSEALGAQVLRGNPQQASAKGRASSICTAKQAPLPLYLFTSLPRKSMKYEISSIGYYSYGVSSKKGAGFANKQVRACLMSLPESVSHWQSQEKAIPHTPLRLLCTGLTKKSQHLQRQNFFDLYSKASPILAKLNFYAKHQLRCCFARRGKGVCETGVCYTSPSEPLLRKPKKARRFVNAGASVFKSKIPYERTARQAVTQYSFATRYPLTSKEVEGQELDAEGYSSASKFKRLKDRCYIVRPLLFISRIELNKICYFWELPLYPDKSNQKVKFLRNRVRRQLLPSIKLFFNSNIENIFLQLAKIVETEDYYLTSIMNKFTQNY